MLYKFITDTFLPFLEFSCSCQTCHHFCSRTMKFAVVLALFVCGALSIAVPVSSFPGEGTLGYFKTDKCDGELLAVKQYFNGFADLTYVPGADEDADTLTCFTNPYSDLCT